MCNSGGYVVAICRKTDAIFSFRCSCEIADLKKISKGIRQWSHNMINDYKPDNDSVIIHATINNAESIKKKIVDHAMLAANDHTLDPDEDSPW